jgi:uncharacterized membrane protein (DUF485 family)
VDHPVTQDPDLRALRGTARGFTFPVTAGFLLWYLLYVLLSGYARGFMATRVLGSINMALLLGLLQFASTFAIAAWYARFAGRRLDPLAAALRGRHTPGAPAVPAPPGAPAPALPEEAAE